jgi:2-polyprenyl-3-methyl-5-hydroxy-6-metoxy-1,4-benzoquinol methylase
MTAVLASTTPLPQTGESVVPCQLCGGSHFELVCRHDRRGRELNTVVCHGCGLVSHQTIPTDEMLAQYYAHEYRQDYHQEFQPSPRRVIREWHRGQARFDLLRPWIQPGGRVMEIGSGIGCNLKPFELSGFDTTGIEPGEGFCKFSRERLGCQVRQASLNDLPTEANYDLVLLVHVLEHLNSPRESLRRMRGLLRDGGRLYVEVPNLAAPHPGLANICHFAHIYNFTPWTLIALGRASGLEVEQVLSASQDGNLAVLFRRAEAEQLPPPGLFEQTQALLATFEPWSYYLRPSYVAGRISRMVRQLSERFAAERRLSRILERCKAA